MIRNLKAVQVIPTTKAVQVIPTAKAVQVIPTAKAVQVIPTAKVVQVVPTAKVEANTWPSKFDPGSALTMMRSLEEAAVRWKDAMKCRSVVTKLILVDSSVVLFLKKWVSICLSFLSWGNALSLQLYCPEPDQEWHYICYLQHDWAYAWVRIWAPVLWIVAVPCLLIPTAPSVPWRTCASQDSFQCIVLRGPCLPAQFWSQKQDWTFIFIDLDFPCYTCFCQVATYRPNIHLNLAKTPGGGWLLFASFQTLLKSYLSVTCVRTSVTNAPWHTMAGFWCLLLWRLARTRRGIGFGKPRPWSNSAAPPKKRPSLQARTWWWLKTWTHQHSPALMWATYMERTNMPRSVVMRRRNCSRPPLILDMFQYFSKESLWHNTRLLFTCGWRLSRTLILAFPSASDPRMVWTLRTTLRCWWLTRPPWLETFLKVSLKCQGLPTPPWSTCQFSVMKVTKNGSTVTSSKSLPKSSFKTSWRSRVLQSALHGIEYILICVCVCCWIWWSSFERIHEFVYGNFAKLLPRLPEEAPKEHLETKPEPPLLKRCVWGKACLGYFFGYIWGFHWKVYQHFWGIWWIFNTLSLNHLCRLVVRFARLSCLRLKSRNGGRRMTGRCLFRSFRNGTLRPKPLQRTCPKKRLRLLPHRLWWRYPESDRLMLTWQSTWWMKGVLLGKPRSVPCRSSTAGSLQTSSVRICQCLWCQMGGPMSSILLGTLCLILLMFVCTCKLIPSNTFCSPQQNRDSSLTSKYYGYFFY